MGVKGGGGSSNGCRGVADASEGAVRSVKVRGGTARLRRSCGQPWRSKMTGNEVQSVALLFSEERGDVGEGETVVKVRVTQS